MRHNNTHFNRQDCLCHPYAGTTALFLFQFSENHKVLNCEGRVLKQNKIPHFFIFNPYISKVTNLATVSHYKKLTHFIVYFSLVP
jgi:hypothetical protein